MVCHFNLQLTTETSDELGWTFSEKGGQSVQRVLVSGYGLLKATKSGCLNLLQTEGFSRREMKRKSWNYVSLGWTFIKTHLLGGFWLKIIGWSTKSDLADKEIYYLT